MFMTDESDIKKDLLSILRKHTGAPIIECRKYLTACNWDVISALEKMKKEYTPLYTLSQKGE